MPSSSSAIRSTSNRVIQGDCLKVLDTLPENSVDLICTDPPYGIGFLGNAWDTFGHSKRCAQGNRSTPNSRARCSDLPGDANRRDASSFRVWFSQVGAASLRVLKPGAFAFFCLGSRQDSISAAIAALTEAGFKTDFTSLYWTYASGFPKALNIGKAIDKRLGMERHIVGRRLQHDIRNNGYGAKKDTFVEAVRGGPVSPEAKRLDGAYAGFQPKPAVEVIVVAMKPLSEKTHVDQARENGKGVTWLDPCRIPSDEPISIHDAPRGTFAGGPAGRGSITNYRESTGRFPPNLLISDEVLGDYSRFFSLDTWFDTLPFLAVAKTGRRERRLDVCNSVSTTSNAPQKARMRSVASNTHPTVKPLKLMSYLITLGSRPGDLILDPFLGSGTTAVAAKVLGRQYVGIDREPTYLAIASARLKIARPCRSV